ncbi:hypothetical protein [Modestobacter sp. I12A-02662]|uniref:LppU/SCO3897 family protein n=1 Tax=Modestobacter sp. I12A-02662 TaxID=1730496 RepID=UPI0034DE1CD4
MSTPGGPQPPEQDPDQPGQPQGWGQQPPPGQPWGPPPGWGQQPPPGQPWGPPSGSGAHAFGHLDPQKQRPRRWLTLLGPVLVALVVVLSLIQFLGGGDPEAGDCIQQSGGSDFETVDCGSDEAEYRIVGTDADMTGVTFDLTDPGELCLDFPEATAVFWYGSDNESDGTVYCAVAA